MITTARVAFSAAILLQTNVCGAQGPQDDALRIQAVFDALTEAWRNADGEAFGRQFAEDADFTVWFGLELQGRDAIAAGHQGIFDSVYANTSFELDINRLRQFDDVAIAHLNGYVVEEGGARSETPDAVPISVLHRTDDGWKIVALHNTAYIVEEVGESIPLAAFKQLVREGVQGQP